MGKNNSWDPNDYSLEDQIKDIAQGWDVSAGEDGSVIKVREGSVGKAFIPSESAKKHDRYDLKNNKWEKSH